MILTISMRFSNVCIREPASLSRPFNEKKSRNHQYNALSISGCSISPNTYSKRIKASPRKRDMKRRQWVEIVTNPTEKAIQWPCLKVAIYIAIVIPVLKEYSCKYMCIVVCYCAPALPL